MFRLIACLMVAVILAMPSTLIAADAKVGTAKSTNVTVIGANNGATTVDLRADVDGNLMTSDGSPRELQNDAFPACDSSNTFVFGGVLRPLGLGWPSSMFGLRSILITRVTSGPAVPLRLYLFGSDDDINYHPVVSDSAWVVRGWSQADTTRIDTVMTVLPWQAPGTVASWKIGLPERPYAGRYMQIWAMRTDSASAGATNTQKIKLTYEGRWK